MSVSVMVLIGMTVVVAVLAVYRNVVARGEDNFLHMADPTAQRIDSQVKMAHSLSQVDRTGMAFTVATAAYGVALFAAYMYSEFVQRGRF